MSDLMFSHPMLNQIWLQVRAGKISAAEQQCKQLLQNEPHLADAWFLLADIALRCNQLAQAESCLQQALELDPTNEQYQFALANTATLRGNDRQAYNLLTQLVEKTRNYAAWQLFARCCWRLGYYQDSIRAFALVATSFPDKEETVLPLARALCSLGDFKGAEKSLQPVLEAARHGGESAQLHLHLTLTTSGPAVTLEQCINWLKIFPAHQGLSDLAAALSKILKRPFHKELSAVQASSLNWLLSKTDSTLWCGLPVEVLFHAMQKASEPGLWIEAGVYHGRSIRLMAQAGRAVHGFDSFQGLPEDWKEGEKAGSYSTQGQLPEVPEYVQLHPGWFEQTLPAFIQKQTEPVRLLHIDCDLYSSTKTVLNTLEPQFVPGTVIVFDDFLGYQGFEQHELKALNEFCLQTGWQYTVLAVALLSREIAIQLTEKHC